MAFRVAIIVAGVGTLMFILSPRTGTTARPMTPASAPPPVANPAAGGPLWPGSPASPVGTADRVVEVVSGSAKVAGNLYHIGKQGVDALGQAIDR